MAVLRQGDVKKMNAEDAKKKLGELERGMLELEGEGKREKRKPLKQAMARLKTHIHSIESSKTK